MCFYGIKTAVGAGLFLMFSTVTGQVTFPDLVKYTYGLNQELVNGIQYSNRYLRSVGHPYFLTDMFENGSVTINGSVYQNVQLKYDLLSQHVEIEYADFSGGNYRLLTVSDRMDAFRLGEYEFRKLKFEEDQERYYQVLHSLHFDCFVHWEKVLIPLNNSVVYVNHFTNARLYCWLKIDGETNAFNDRKTFARSFPVYIQKEILKLLRRKHVSFRNDTPEEIIRIINEVANLFHTEDQP